jgi:DNA-binding XRE family transcriptional regulator
MNLKQMHEQTKKSKAEMAKLSGVTKPTYYRVIEEDENVLLGNYKKVRSAIKKVLREQNRNKKKNNI